VGERNDARRVVETNPATVAMPSDREIVITRVFTAPRQVVFDAWTKPEHVTHWWDPNRTPLAVCEIDLRPNGEFRFVNSGRDGTTHPFVGIYRHIEPPGRLVFTTRVGQSGAESVGTLVFSEHQGRTTLTMTMTCQSKADRDLLLQMRVDVGTMHTLDNLQEYLAAQMGSTSGEAGRERS
jgi:uncharacterized protein YndB with AHSA1/START domain